MVVLEPGDALVVPPKWWHYVEHISPIGISLNTWIPCVSKINKFFFFKSNPFTHL